MATGFGVRDSIINIAEEQYEEIQTFDVGVTFKESCEGEQKEKFLKNGEGNIESAVFAMETTMDMEVEQTVKSVNLVSMDETQEIGKCLSLHTVKGEEMNTIEMKVSGSCENFVYNYVFISNTTYC